MSNKPDAYKRSAGPEKLDARGLEKGSQAAKANVGVFFNTPRLGQQPLRGERRCDPIKRTSLDVDLCEAAVRNLGSLVGILVVALVVGLIYRYYFSQNQQAAPISHPQQTIDVTGVENDLVAIAQAERVYQTEHNSYGSLDDLVATGAMTVKKSGRQGYTYEAEASTESFRIIARCSTATRPGCSNYVIDQTMEVRPAP